MNDYTIKLKTKRLRYILETLAKARHCHGVTLPVVSYVKIERLTTLVGKQRLSFSLCILPGNLTAEIELSEAESAEPGQAEAFPARLVNLQHLLRFLSPVNSEYTQLDMVAPADSAAPGRLEVTGACDGVRATINLPCLPVEEFPYIRDTWQMPERWSECFTYPANLLGSHIRDLSKLASRDETRIILSGIHFGNQNGCAELVATDTHRLGIYEIGTQKLPEDGFTISQADMRFLAAALRPQRVSAEPIRIKHSGKDDAVCYEWESSAGQGEEENKVSWRMFSELISGKFVNYRRVVPYASHSGWTARVKVREMIAAVRLCFLSAQDNSNRVVFSPTGGEDDCGLALRSDGISGNTTATVKCASFEDRDNGKPCDIALNARYFLDVLSCLPLEAHMFLVITEHLRAVMVTCEGLENRTYIVMPMQVI